MGATHFGLYRLDAVLSRGAAATVYRARDTSHHDRVVALKVFDQALSADPVFRVRFRRDAGLLSALREPHVVPIHRHGEIDGRLFLDMRLVRGPSLADVLRDGPLAPPRAAAIAGQIGAATESLRMGGLGDRPLERADVLLTGPPGRGEFVQLVGLGLGRPPMPGADASPAVLVTAPARRRRGRVLLAAGVVVAVVAAALATLVAIRPDQPEPAAAGEPGLVATIAQPVAAVADADIVTSDGRQVLVAVTVDGAVHAWELATGHEVRPATPGSAVAVAAGELDGRAVVAARNRDATVVVQDLLTGAPVGPLLGSPRPAEPSGYPTWGGQEYVDIDGAPGIVTVRPTDALVPDPFGNPTPQIGVQWFGLAGGTQTGPVLAEEGLSTVNFATAEIDGRPVAVSVVGRSSVQVRDLATGIRVGVPTPPQPVAFGALATAVRDGAPVAVTGGDDNTIRIWDLRTGEQVGPPLAGHTEGITALATVALGGRTVLVSAAGGYLQTAKPEVRLWDLATGSPLGTPMAGHPLGAMVATSTDGDRPLLVSAPVGEPITVWDAGRLLEEVTS